MRKIALEHDLITARKKDSTGICFIGERRFADFLQQYLPAQPGNIETPEGEIIGKHNGLMYYTIGQRQGLGIGGLKNYDESPWFAAAKDLERNVLIAVQGDDHDLLYTNHLTLTDIHWIDDIGPQLPATVTCKHRYRQPDQACTISKKENHWLVSFDQPQRAITPGQSAVFYDGEICLGGGVIEATFK